MIGVTNAIESQRKSNAHTLFLLTDDLIDKSIYAATWPFTIEGEVTVNQSQQRDGRNSIYFGNKGLIRLSHCYTPNNNNFTIECWAYFPAIHVRTFYSTRNSSTATNQYGLSCYSDANGGPRFSISTNTSSWNIRLAGSTPNISVATWYHFAMVRNNNNFYAFHNGILVENFTSDCTLIDTGNRTWIGYYNNGTAYYLEGFIQDYRISDIALYTSNFTPPQRLI